MPASTLTVRAGDRADLGRMAVDGRLWAILDACDEPTVPPKVTELGPEKAVSLFRGSAEHEQWNLAPYLAKVDEPLLDWIAGNLWAKPWGIFAVADTDLKTLRRHFRRFLIVEDPDGQTMYFRYYDPRILAAFLPSCNSEELAKIFGPVKAYAVVSLEIEKVQFFLPISGS